MRIIIVSILFILTVKSFSQTKTYKESNLSFELDSIENRNVKDYCTTHFIKLNKVEISKIQRVVPMRANNLNQLIKNCGYKNDYDWTGSSTEISINYDGKEYWLQLGENLETSFLSKIKDGDKFAVFCKVLTEDSIKVSRYLIVEKVIKI